MWAMGLLINGICFFEASYFNIFFKQSCLTAEFLVKNYIFHDSAKKSPPYRKLWESNCVERKCNIVCLTLFLMQIKVCNAVIHLKAGWFGSWYIPWPNWRIMGIPMGKWMVELLLEPKPLKTKWMGAVALHSLIWSHSQSVWAEAGFSDTDVQVRIKRHFTDLFFYRRWWLTMIAHRNPFIPIRINLWLIRGSEGR